MLTPKITKVKKKQSTSIHLSNSSPVITLWINKCQSAGGFHPIVTEIDPFKASWWRNRKRSAGLTAWDHEYIYRFQCSAPHFRYFTADWSELTGVCILIWKHPSWVFFFRRPNGIFSWWATWPSCIKSAEKCPYSSFIFICLRHWGSFHSIHGCTYKARSDLSTAVDPEQQYIMSPNQPLCEGARISAPQRRTTG